MQFNVTRNKQNVSEYNLMIVNFLSRFQVLDILRRFIPKIENFIRVLKDEYNYRYLTYHIHSNSS